MDYLIYHFYLSKHFNPPSRYASDAYTKASTARMDEKDKFNSSGHCPEIRVHTEYSGWVSYHLIKALFTTMSRFS